MLNSVFRYILQLPSFFFKNNLNIFFLKEKKYKKIIEKELNLFSILNNNLAKTHIYFNENLKKILRKEHLYSFLRYSFIQKMFFVHNRLFILFELLELKKNNWKRYKELLVENNFGNPVRYFLYPKSSGNTINQVYHLFILEKNFGISLDNVDFVFEFGGGYGCNARIFSKINKKSTYLIYDTSFVSLLQFYYLNIINIKSCINKFKKKYCILINKLNLLSKINLNKYNNRLFIANWSISECPLAFRENFFKIIYGSNLVLISFQENFEKINNLKYFTNLQKRLSNKFEVRIIRNKYYKGNIFKSHNHYYFIAQKKL